MDPVGSPLPPLVPARCDASGRVLDGGSLHVCAAAPPRSGTRAHLCSCVGCVCSFPWPWAAPRWPLACRKHLVSASCSARSSTPTMQESGEARSTAGWLPSNSLLGRRGGMKQDHGTTSSRTILCQQRRGDCNFMPRPLVRLERCRWPPDAASVGVPSGWLAARTRAHRRRDVMRWLLLVRSTHRTYEPGSQDARCPRPRGPAQPTPATAMSSGSSPHHRRAAEHTL